MTRIEALAILGNPIDDISEVKQSYRKAALKYHPDHGGDLRQMQLVNDAYELLCKILNRGQKTWGEWHFKKANEQEPLTEQVKRAYEAIKHLPSIKIELCGSWLWVSGNTKAVKTELKAAGYRWNRKKSMWSWHADGYRKRSRKTYTHDEVRARYGSQDLETEEAQQIAA